MLQYYVISDYIVYIHVDNHIFVIYFLLYIILYLTMYINVDMFIISYATDIFICMSISMHFTYIPCISMIVILTILQSAILSTIIAFVILQRALE